MAIKGTCKNCGRTDLTLPAHDICGGCYFRVKDMEWDSPECKAALAQAKKDFNNPGYKQVHKRKSKTKEISTKHFKKTVMPPDSAFKKLSMGNVQEAKAHVKALGIKQSGGNPDTAFVIGMIDVQIEEYKKRLDKLNQAKQILAA